VDPAGARDDPDPRTLTREDIDFIKTNMADWLVEQSLGKPAAVYEIELRERAAAHPRAAAAHGPFRYPINAGFSQPTANPCGSTRGRAWQPMALQMVSKTSSVVSSSMLEWASPGFRVYKLLRSRLTTSVARLL
jgi:hypothetical protein